MKRTLLAMLAGSVFVMVGCISSTDEKKEPTTTDDKEPTAQASNAKNDDPTSVKAIVEENTIGTSNGTDKGSSGSYLTR